MCSINKETLPTWAPLQHSTADKDQCLNELPETIRNNQAIAKQILLATRNP